MTAEQDIATVREALDCWNVMDGEADSLAALDRLAERLEHAEKALDAYSRFDDVIATLADVRKSGYWDLQNALARFRGTP